jgi:hypothetical protein
VVPQDLAGSLAVVGSAQNKSDAQSLGIVRRIFNRIHTALWDSYRRRVEREIALVIGGSADHITDELERQIEEHIVRNGTFRV